MILLPAGVLGAPVVDEHVDQFMKKLFQPAPSDSDVVAVVEGKSITGKDVRQAMVVVQANQPGLSETDARRAAFRIVARDRLAQGEARRRGIQVSREEAQTFTDTQRAMANQLTGADRQLVTEDIRSSGLSEEDYWKRQVDVYAGALLVAKLRQQVIAEVPNASPEDQQKHYDAFLDKLLGKAQIEYRDPALR